MKSKTEQIEAILTGDFSRLATEGLHLYQILDDHHFGDLINVTTEDIEKYIAMHGFHESVVSDVSKTRRVRSDCINIYPMSEGWEVFYESERGDRTNYGRFSSYRDAVLCVIQKLIDSAIVHLSARFRAKYFSGTVLPNSGEPWPDGKVRY